MMTSAEDQTEVAEHFRRQHMTLVWTGSEPLAPRSRTPLAPAMPSAYRNTSRTVFAVVKPIPAPSRRLRDQERRDPHKKEPRYANWPPRLP